MRVWDDGKGGYIPVHIYGGALSERVPCAHSI